MKTLLGIFVLYFILFVSLGLLFTDAGIVSIIRAGAGYGLLAFGLFGLVVRIL